MKRMKYIATFLFAVALVGSILVWPYRGSFTGGLLFAAFEAALVGALADWFAVVALFRHPLGLKFIPHTAIIPNNRGRIVDGIVEIVEKDWLSLDFIRSKILDYNLLDNLALALESEEGRHGLERITKSLLANTVQDLNPDDMARFIHLMLTDNLGEIKISPNLVVQIESSLKNLYGEDVIQIFLDWAIASTRGEEFEQIIRRTLQRAAADYSNKGNYLRRLSKGLGESLDIFNYDEGAVSVSNRINLFLVQMKDPNNNLHIKVRTELDKLHIADPETASAKLGELLQKVVGTEAGIVATAEVLAALKNQMMASDLEDSLMIRYISNLVIKQFTVIRQDEERKMSVENWIKNELTSLLERYHGVIGHIVREKLQSLNDIGLVESLEDKVGNDLQWIRINGTVIGALVGVAQYLLLHLF